MAGLTGTDQAEQCNLTQAHVQTVRLGVGQGDTVKTDLHLDDVVDTIAGATLNLGILIRREALVISGCSTPTPAQNSFKPPPEPVDSILGVLNLEVLPNCSATTVANG